ncbi:Fibrocystin-L [Mactra antiquata]
MAKLLYCWPITSDTTVPVTVVTNGTTLTGSGSFTYKNTNAKILSVTPSTLTVHEGQIIEVSGQNMGTIGDVLLGGNVLTVETRNDTYLKAITSQLASGVQTLKVMMPNQGCLLNSTNEIPSFDVQLYAHFVSPQYVSLFGDIQVTISGLGFGTSKDSIDKLSFDDVPCEVTEVTNTYIVCNLGDHATTYYIDNLGTTGDGEFFTFNKSSIIVEVRDSVCFKWNFPDFLSGSKIGIYETIDLISDEILDNGINSGARTRQGQYCVQFDSAGTRYMYSGKINDDNVAARMIIYVVEKEDYVSSLYISVANQEADQIISASSSGVPDPGSCPVSPSNYDQCVPSNTNNPDDSRIPLYFTKCRTPTVTSQSHIPAISGQSNTITGNTKLTLTGSGFSTSNCANEPMIGDCLCTVTGQSTETQVTFEPDANCQLPVGTFLHLSLIVKSYGRAQNVEGFEIVVVPSIISISPNEGSTNGGTEVTIEVYGVTEQSVVGVTLNEISAECSLNELKKLVCITPVSSTGPLAVTVNGYQSVCNATSDCKFSYKPEKTPTISSIVRTGSDVEFIGTNFGTDVGKLDLAVNDVSCSELTVNGGGTILTCNDVPNIVAGNNDVSLLHADLGYANVLGYLTGVLNIETLTPTSGSLNGGTNISISGSGFDAAMSVTVGDPPVDFCDSMYVARSTQMYCSTKAMAAGTVELSFVSNGVSSIGSKSFEFSDAATPKISNISPVSGTVGTELTLTVENFGSDANDVSVGTGDVKCNNVILEYGSTVKCTTGMQSGGSHAVWALVDGMGLSNSDHTYAYEVTVSTISPMQGDVLGGEDVTLVGAGFTEEMTVEVCDKLCTFEKFTEPDTYVCITPPGVVGQCDVKLALGTTTVIAQHQYEYQEDVGAKITNVTPMRGGTMGGTTLTFTGVRLVSPLTVTIDNVDCVVTPISDTSFTCVTGAHTGTIASPIEVRTDGQRVLWSSLNLYQYVDVWSSSYTWNGNPAPLAGDYVVIPEGQTVLLDTDTPILDMLLINGGSLIFDDNGGDITLNAQRILITNEGSLIVGTEDEPYQSQATIMLHGHVLSKELPIYGTKMIGLRNGTLNIHGRFMFLIFEASNE